MLLNLFWITTYHCMMMDTTSRGSLGNPSLILLTLGMIPVIYFIRQFLGWLIFTYRRNRALKQFPSPPGHWLMGNITGVSHNTQLNFSLTVYCPKMPPGFMHKKFFCQFLVLNICNSMYPTCVKFLTIYPIFV